MEYTEGMCLQCSGNLKTPFFSQNYPNENKSWPFNLLALKPLLKLKQKSISLCNEIKGPKWPLMFLPFNQIHLRAAAACLCKELVEKKQKKPFLHRPQAEP